ncbi:MMPL family transporter [Streptacidiphilus sp. PAMC 29251]
MSTYLYRLGRWSFRHRRAVLLMWLVGLVAVVVLAQASGGKTNDNFSVPGTQSQQAADLLKQKIPAFSGGSTQIVVAADGQAKVTDPAVRTGIETALAKIRTGSQVATVSDPFQARTVSANGRAALITVQYTEGIAQVKDASLTALQNAVQPVRASGAQVEFSGSVYPGSRPPVSELPEIIGIAVGFLILLVTFGAFVAAGLPILTAVIGVGVALMGITALAAVVDVGSASTALAIMLGLSCGIDYALFVASRHRSNLMRGMTVEESVALAVGTSGSSVVFAALTVMVALCGLSLAGIPFLTVMGLCAAGSVLIALLIALTLVPALLGFAGMRVTRFLKLPGRRGPGRAERTAIRGVSDPERTAGAVWAGFVVRFRIPVLIAGVALLAVIALPSAKLQLGLPSGQTMPAASTAHKSYDLISETFGPGYNGPLLVVADLTHAAGPAAGQQLTTALRQQSGVVSANLSITQNQTAIIQVIPATGPNDAPTAHLVNQIRHDAVAITGQTGAKILVGGTTAGNIDTSNKLSSALPVFLVVVIGLALALLTLAFRTVLIPIKSVVGFLLSAFAAFGAEVAVFQWGWAKSLFGITPSETISFLPILLIAIIFGLSSDYEIFLVSRIKEEFTRGGDAVEAVRRGTGMSARVVSSAALIMFAVFVAFIAGDNATIKAIGFSLAVGVFLDAFVVRLTLVPAVMALVGKRIWYHPRWFDRYVPDLDIEGDRLEQAHPGPGSTPHPKNVRESA